jgi:hypothetical protein
MSRRLLKNATRGCLILGGGLALGALAALAGSSYHAEKAFATTNATCTVDGSNNVTVTINGDSTVTLSVHGANLTFDGGACGGGVVATSVASLTFAVGSPSAPTTVILDQTDNGGIFPCFPIEGTIGSGTLQVNALHGESVVFGSTGVNLNSCGSVGSLGGVTSYAATADAAPVTVSAAGGAGTGSPTSATFTPPPSTSTYTIGSNVNLEGSAGTYTITSTGSGNQITAGAGTESFTVNGNGVQLIGGPGTDSFTVSGSTNTIQGTSGGTYTITNNGTGTQVIGGPGSETFKLGGTLAPFTGGSGGTYTLSGPTSTTVLASGSQVSAGPGAETFSIKGPVTNVTLVGTTDPAGNASFTVTGASGSNNNTLTGGTGTDGFTLSGNNNTYNGGPGTDTVNITGSSNDFIVGSGAETFIDSAGPNTVDFSHVGAGPTAPLVINVAGSAETVSGTLVQNGHATQIGSTVTDSFRDSPTASTSNDFTTFIGATGGSTEFLAGSNPGLSFNGQGTGNSAAFFGGTGVVVNVSGVFETTSAQTSIGSGLPLPGFQIGSGQVLVTSPPSGTDSCTTSICDSVVDVTTVTGPPSGFSTFFAGAAPNTFTFSDAGDHNTFIAGTGTANFSSGGNFNTFVAGSGTETFTETTGSQQPTNTIDFSAVPVGSASGCTQAPCDLVVNVSGTHTAVPNFGAALFNAAQAQIATYSFGSGGADFTIFVGAAGGDTTFDGGSGNYTYQGQGIGNSLDFSPVSSAIATSLTFDLTHTPLPQVTLGTVPESFSGITNLVGLTAGGTSFVGGSTGGFTFSGNGTGNQASFSTQGPSTTLTVKVTSGGNPVTAGTVTFSVAGGATLCQNVPVSGGVASCYATSLPAGTDQIVAVYTPVTGTSLSGSGVVLTATGAGTGPTTTTTVLSVPSGTIFQGQSSNPTLTATVSSVATVNSGTVTFSIAGGQTLCTAVPVSGGTATCSPSLPAGTFDILAVYTPSSNALGGSVGQAPVTVNVPQASSVDTVTYNPGTGVASANVTVPASFSGTLTITDPEIGFSCSVGVTTSGIASCLIGAAFQGEELIAVLSPSAGVPVASSAGVSTPLTSGNCCIAFTPSNTALSSSDTTTNVGTIVTLTATVTATSGTLPGGTVTFSLVGGSTLCTVAVPNNVSSTQVDCQTTLPAGSDELLAEYSNSSFATAGSAAVVAVTVQTPTPTLAAAVGSPTQDRSPGVVVNLSSNPFTTSATSPVPGVLLQGGQVLVAAPPAGSSSCGVTPLPTFCDSLVDINAVTGSAQGRNTFIAGSGSEFFLDTGTVGGDAINFSNVTTGPSTPLNVNVSGRTGSFTATVGTTTYTFTTGGLDFNTFTGSSGGNTVFLASGAPGYTFNASGSSNSVDFSAAPSGVTVDLSTWTAIAPTGTVNVPGIPLQSIAGGVDTITGLTTVIGSSAGANVFKGGPSPGTFNFTGNGNGNLFVGFAGTGGGVDIFNSNGTGNTFRAGTGAATFVDPGTGNTVDFSALTSLIVVNVAGRQVNNTPNDTATDPSLTKYDFTSFGTTPVTFLGSPGGTTYFGGASADQFNGQGLPNDTLSYAFTTTGSTLVICLVQGPGCDGSSVARLDSLDEPFSGITKFTGLNAGSSTLVATGTEGASFTATGTNNVADFSKAASGLTIDMVHGIAGTDTFSGVTSVVGSLAGHNTFVAGSGSETFGDTGTAGQDTINFSAVQTGSGTPLTVNVSGGPVNGQASYTAVVGPATYTFFSLTTSGLNFTHFTGAGNGGTVFLASGFGGYNFTATSSGNSIDFTAAGSGVLVDLSGGPSGSVSQLTANPVTASTTDSISGLTTVTGSSAGGNTFMAGPSTATYNFTGNGNGNTFFAGTGTATFVDPGSSNTINFSNLGTALIVNVSGRDADGTATNTALSNGVTYTFGPAAATFKGSGGGTTFLAGTTADTFAGKSLPGDSLDYSFASTTPLTICLVVGPGCSTANQAIAGSTHEPFSGISNFVGLSIGSTTFVAKGSEGDSFTASGSNNVADFSAAPAGITIDLVHGTAGTDTLVGITSVVGSSTGNNTFIAGPSSESFASSGPNNAIDFSNLSTSGPSPLTINVSGTTANGVDSFTAVDGGAKYTFQSGFNSFTGSSGGNTHFLASGSTGGYRFTAKGSSNTADFSADANGISADMTTGLVQLGGGPSDSLLGTFLTRGTASTIIGSSTGANTFFGALLGTNFVSSGQVNTVSYLEFTGGAVTANLQTSRISPGSGVLGTADTFSFPAGALTVQGSPANDTFIIGTASAILEGGGGADTIDLSGLTAGVTVDLNGGSIFGTSINGITFTVPNDPSCTVVAECLNVAKVTGTPFADTFIANNAALDGTLAQLTINGNGGSDTLDLSNTSTQSATIHMPIGSGTGSVTGNNSAFTGVLFTKIANINGTSGGGDDVFAGSGTATFNEPGSASTATATLDFSALTTATSLTIDANDQGGLFTGTVSSPQSVGVTETFTGFSTFIGSAGADTFVQSGPSPDAGYVFDGKGGANILDLSSEPTGTTVTLTSPLGGDGCTGSPNNDGTVSGNGVSDTFSCIGDLKSASATYLVSPGQTAKIEGGGSGTLELIGTGPGPGATINLVNGAVSGDGYGFSFTGIATVVGTPGNDTFIPGAGNVTIVGGGGSDTVSFLGAPAAVVVNDSSLSYTIPSGFAGAGTNIPAFTATGGYGGTVVLTNISNITGTSSFSDLMVAPNSGVGYLSGGSGNDRFVLTGGTDYIAAGAGNSTLDLSQLSGITAFNMLAGPQYLGGPADGAVWIVSGNVTTVIASPGGSTLLAGPGNITLVGGPGNDTLEANTGNQTLVGGGGTDVLKAGVGTDTLEGGSQPVTFFAGIGSDVLTSQTSGNTLSYDGAPGGVLVNLSTNQTTVPAGNPVAPEPFANKTLAPQTANGGWGAVVDLSQANIRQVIGSGFGDVFVTGSTGDNISGNGGNDLFVIVSGNNTLVAAPGSNSRFLFDDGAGSNNVLNGGGLSTIDFSQSGNAVTVNLQSGQATGGFGGTQALSGILNIIGSTGSGSHLIASAPNAIVIGLGSNDTLVAGPTGNDTLINDGTGGDTFCAATGTGGCQIPAVAGGPDTLIATRAGATNFFFAQNGAVDTIEVATGSDNKYSVDPTDKIVFV